MTIIAAVRDAARRCTWLGADTRTMSSGTIISTTTAKCRVEGRYGVATSGYGGLASVVDATPGLFDGEPSAAVIANRIREGVEAASWRSKDDPGPRNYQISMIIVIGGEIYDADCAFDLSLIDDHELWARGSGMEYALGAGHAMRRTKDAKRRIEAALAAACRFDPGCGGAIHLYRVPWE